MQILYHRTNKESAEAILREGFRDSTDYYGTVNLYTGVWFSSVPFDENEGAFGVWTLRVTVDLSEEQLALYEWVEEHSSARTWLVPASVVNGCCKIEVEDIPGD